MGKRSSVRVCIVIPAYNEAAVIGSVIAGVRNVFQTSSYQTTVVVVDDGSRDGTAKVSQSAGAHVIKHILNTGAGGATATGLSFAEQNDYDIAVTMDADGQHHPDDILLGVDTLHSKKVDLLIGSRLVNSQGMSRVKVLGNRGLSLVTAVIFGVRTTDSQSGLRVFSKKALGELRWKTSGYEFCSEMLWRAKQKHLIIDEFPIKAIYTDYSKAKGQNNWNAVNIVKSLLRRRIMELFSE